MDKNDSTKKSVWESVGRVAEGTAAAAGGAVGAVLAGPLGGVAGAAGVVTGIEGLRALVRGRTAERATRFETSLIEQLAKCGVEDLAQHSEKHPEFAEVAFQNYRRCVDAIDPGVAPALARLTVSYSSCPPDGFLRGIGRILEDISAEELTELQLIISNAVATELDPVQIINWVGEGGRLELRLDEEDKKHGRIFGMIRPAAAPRLLWLLKVHGLTTERIPNGVDLATEGRTTINRETLQLLEEILLPVPPSMFRSDFKRNRNSTQRPSP